MIGVQAWLFRLPIAGGVLFLMAFFLVPDQHELRLVFNWAVVLPTLLLLPWRWRDIKHPGPTALVGMALAGWLCLSVYWGDSAGFSYFRYELMNPLFVALLVIAAMFAGMADPKRWPPLEVLLIGLGCVVALLALYDYAALGQGSPDIPGWPRLEGRGILKNPLVIAALLGVCILLAIVRFHCASSFLTGLPWLLAATPMAVAMVATQSRGPILALLIALPFAVRSKASGERRHWIWFAILLAGVVFAVANMRLLYSTLMRGEGTGFRAGIWHSVVKETAPDWIVGQGLRVNRSVKVGNEMFPHSHNSLLSVFRFGGLVGASLFMAFWGSVLRGAYRLPDEIRRGLVPWLVFGFVCQLTNGTFPFLRPGYDWFLTWLPIAFALAARQGRLAQP